MDNAYLASIMIFAGNFAPKGWAFCNGQILSIAQNTALFSLLGTTYGGNGQTTFSLPDLRGRAAVGAGQGPGLQDYFLGQQAGVEVATLAINQLPAHTHTFSNGTMAIAAASTPGNRQSPANAVPAAEAVGVTATYSTANPDVLMSPNMLTGSPTLASTGGGQPVSVMQPYLALSYIIALVGIFPSRN